MPAGRAFSAGGESDIIGISHGSREKRAEKEKRMEALMEWTKPQKETIETRGKNILVSAAAGSGKTAVLIERITRLVIDEKTDIDRFLITTFTNAAAAEMKSRLEKAISKQMDEPGADRSFLRRQLSMMPRANISTFHTFALEVMRRYFYLTDLEPGFSIGDDVEVSIMKNDAAARLFEDRFGEDYDAFSLFLRKYSSDRSEERIKKNIISLYDEMRSIPQYMDWAERTSRLLDAKSPSEALGLTGFIADEVEKGVAEACRLYERAAQTLEEAGIDSLSEKAAQDVEKLTDMAERLGQKDAAAEKLELFNDFISTVKLNQMRAAKSQQEDYDQVKEQVSRLRKGGKKALDDLKKKYFARTMEDYDEELRAGYEDTMYLTGLLKEFEEIFREMKADRNMVDFDDVMHYAILILQDDMAADEYRKRFRYIFIDEFQDSNMLQEAIVGRITDGRNLFMVGDVKQSIYKFRLAEPEIFRRKYQLYARQSEENSVKIDLNSNFRSKLLVTETVNRVFSSAMEGYDENARLKCTVDEVHPGMATQCHIVDGSEAEDIRGDLDPEAQLVAELIRESLGNEIYDVKKGVARKVEYRDIVVLSRSRSAIGRMERFLNNEGIPAYGENTGGYFETVEVQVFVNLLRIIDNTRQDIPLISVMRSPVFDFHVRELAAVRIETRDGSFYDAVRAFAEADHGGDEDAAALAAKIEEMFHQIACWKELKNTVTLEELTRILLYDTGYFDYCSGLPAGKRRISNLRLLVEKAGQFEQNSHIYRSNEKEQHIHRGGQGTGRGRECRESHDSPQEQGPGIPHRHPDRDGPHDKIPRGRDIHGHAQGSGSRDAPCGSGRQMAQENFAAACHRGEESRGGAGGRNKDTLRGNDESHGSVIADRDGEGSGETGRERRKGRIFPGDDLCVDERGRRDDRNTQRWSRRCSSGETGGIGYPYGRYIRQEPEGAERGSDPADR